MIVVEAFAGLGGMALGAHRAGCQHAAFIERESYPRRVLARHWPNVPQHDDILTFSAAPYRGRVDALIGGPPCQPVSVAGKRGGTADSRWLWGAFVDLAVALDVPVVIAENPPGLLHVQGGDAFAAALRTFGDAGYAVEWDMLSAGSVGAPHRRERVFVVARRDGVWRSAPGATESLFPGRPGRWPVAGRWAGGRLTTHERRWPTPKPLPWEIAADAEALPTPTAQDATGRDYQVSGATDQPTLGHAAKRAAGAESQLDRRRVALPTPQAADGERGSETMIRGEGNPTLLGAARRRALPTPTAAGGDGGDGGEASCDSARAGGPDLRAEARRRALPTPAARDFRDAGRDRSGSPHAQPLPQALVDRGLAGGGQSGRLNPALPEWMLGLPDGWSAPDGPSLADAASRPYLPDLTAELALTTRRKGRRERLRALGNACQVEVAETIVRANLLPATGRATA